MISIMKAEKLVRHGCEAFLASMTTGVDSKAKLLDIYVVQDFPDVLLEELPRLPPPREVEFTIELVLGM